VKPPIRLELGSYAAASLQISLGGQFCAVEGLQAQSTELVLRLVEEGLSNFANSFKPWTVYGESRQFSGVVQQTDRSFISLRLMVHICHSRGGGRELSDYLDFVLAQAVAGAHRLMRRARFAGIIKDPEEFKAYCDYLAAMLIHEPEDELDFSEMLEVGVPDGLV
jgi:hypothetical protein